MAVHKILIVDDSPTERFFLADLLSKQGYQINLAENGTEALEKAKQIMPDLILMDVVMPGLNGFQATRALSKDEELKHIPVILCTTKDQETDKIWGLRQGAIEYIIKPVDGNALLQKIRSL
ncbi:MULTISPECIES: response regulator [Sulfuriferula]|uniref:response regulator n=1 Tax=Sulfuriferula TaxID=1778653 RepID=UPI000B3B9532|nr:MULTISPECIES: response regulator [Sulfuriferula]ARU30622.1 two-component system response regulator [Sulfuriferula sp. AH1]